MQTFTHTNHLQAPLPPSEEDKISRSGARLTARRKEKGKIVDAGAAGRAAVRLSVNLTASTTPVMEERSTPSARARQRRRAGQRRHAGGGGSKPGTCPAGAVAGTARGNTSRPTGDATAGTASAAEVAAGLAAASRDDDGNRHEGSSARQPAVAESTAVAKASPPRHGRRRQKVTDSRSCSTECMRTHRR